MGLLYTGLSGLHQTRKVLVVCCLWRHKDLDFLNFFYIFTIFGPYLEKVSFLVEIRCWKLDLQAFNGLMVLLKISHFSPFYHILAIFEWCPQVCCTNISKWSKFILIFPETDKMYPLNGNASSSVKITPPPRPVLIAFNVRIIVMVFGPIW